MDSKNLINVYIRLIKTKTINNTTSKSWTVDDVPILWRKEVELELDKRNTE